MIKEAPFNALMTVSSAVSRAMGKTPVSEVRFETPGQVPGVWAYSLPIFQGIGLMSGMQVNGKFPDKGAGLVISNHISTLDPFWAHCLVAETAQRSIRAWAKISAIDPNKKETALADIGRTHKDSLGSLGRRLIAAPYVRSFDPIPATIGGQNRKALRMTRQALNDNQLVWIFIQGHRRPAGDLLAYMPGAAYILKDYPELPVYPVGFSGTDNGLFAPKVMNVGESFTLTQIREEIPEVADMGEGEQVERVGLYMVDRIAQLVEDERHKAAWENGRHLMRTFKLGRERLLRRIHGDPDLSLTRRLLTQVYPTRQGISPQEFLDQIPS